MSNPAAYPDDALAIVGLAFRLPGGVTTLDGLWSALSAGRNLITDIPPERFETSRFFDPVPNRAGKSFTFAGGYVGDVAGFDAEYFGISPREATLMDPQQRLLLEMTADAFDDAGIDPQSVAGTDTSVFVGMSDMGYLALQMCSPETMASHTMSGGALSIASNRLSYTFDLRGPSMTLDTACSSVMVALHQACQAVLSGHSAMAVVGGVHLLLGPHPFIGFAKASMLSPLGRCATFSADADGYVRAEGGGVLLIKRLSAAVEAGDRVHAVIVATEVNTDGRTSGMTVPSVEMQAALLRAVYKRAGVGADDLSYFEAHGTGTPIGDPIECEAVGRALGRLRSPGQPLPIGSVKTNLGHMEPASGISGILKAILVLQRRMIPPSLHGSPPNPLIDFAALGLAPVHESQPVDRGRALVGVNSFGFGGANGHAVLAEAPTARSTPRPDVTELPLVVSARSEPALVEAAGRLADRLTGCAQDEYYDLCHTAARRARHPHRAVVLASTPRSAADGLAAVARGEPADGAASGIAAMDGRVVFVFSGNGSQWPGMGADLITSEPVFQAAIEEVDGILCPRLGWSVLEELVAPPERSRLRNTAFAQPALFAVQVGLVTLFAARGIRPAAVTGHSVGEVAAAYASGALDLEGACRVIAGRSEAQALTAGQGRMAAIGLSPAQAEQALAPFSGRLEIAAMNTDNDVTVSGEAAAVAELASRLDGGVFFRQLDLDYAFHCRHMDAIEQPLRASLRGLRPLGARMPFVSSVTGGPVCGTELDADYWWANVRQPVRFAAATDHLRAAGYDVFLEIGPHPVLTTYLRRITAPSGPTAVLATLRRDTDGPAAVRTATAAMMAVGARVDESPSFSGPGRVVDLPFYPWQRERYWSGTAGQWVRSSGDGTIDHPLLGERMPVLEPTWLATVEPALVPWLESHKLLGAVLWPAVGHVEMAMAAGRRVLHAPVEVTDLAIPALLVLPWNAGMDVRIQTSMSSDDGAFRIASTTGGGTDWRLHAQGRVRRLLCDEPPAVDLASLEERTTRHWDADDFYALLDDVGLQYGPFLQVLRDVYAGPGEVMAYYSTAIDQEGYEAHPAILDGALHAGVPLLEGRSFMPGAIDRVRLWRQPSPTGFVHVLQRSRTKREACWDVVVGDDDGTVVAELRGCRMRRADAEEALSVHCVTVLRAAPRKQERAAPSPLPSPGELVAAARSKIEDLQAGWDQGGYERLEATAKMAAAHYARTAVDAMLAGQEQFTTDDLLTAGMLPKYLRMWQVVARLCVEHGLLERLSSDRWHTTSRNAKSPRVVAGSFLLAQPKYAPDALLWGRIGNHWADLLRGRRTPVDLLFGDGGTDIVEHFYDTSPIAVMYNQLARSLVDAMVQTWPAGRPLRVLEVGAGTGGTTATLLPVLPPERTKYVFTDVSAKFLTAAETRFQAYGFVDYRPLDIDQDLREQGFDEATFDLVVATNVLHVARDLRCALRRLGCLLSPGGQMLACEFHDPDVIVAAVGFLDQFWSFTDDLRLESALLSREQWPGVFRECGFDEVVQCGAAEDPARSDFSVTLARRDRHTPPPSTLPRAEPGASWLVAVEDRTDLGVASEVADSLTAAGAEAVVVIAETDGASMTERVASGTSVVFVLGGDRDGDGAVAVTRAVRQFGVLHAFAKACDTFPPGHGTRLWLVTRPSGALPEPERPLVPEDAALWGAARVLANESADAAIRRISWERSQDATGDARRLALELLDPSEEDEVVLTAAGRFVPRPIERHRPLRPVERRRQAYELELRNQGLSYELAWVEAEPLRPAPDEVVVEVMATALNYMDVMIAMGTMPPDAEGAVAGGEQLIGLEYAGVVAAVGSDVEMLRPGDRVCGVAARSFASHVVTKVEFVLEMPDDMDFADAATLPVAYLTVHHSLDHLARLAPGETILVHGAAGGVGLAAIQYANLVGTNVIATAGTEAKRDLLSLLGVENVLDSRSLAFADQVMALTGGVGVDVVLNSLSGEAISRGLELLRPHGRFVELGKRDIYANSRIMLRTFRKNISLFCVDVSQLAGTRPSLARSEMREIVRRVRAGEYRPLLYRAYPARRIDEAFRLLQHSRHIGKVVVTFDDPVPVEHRPVPVRLDPQATYLISGGLSGLGAAVARGLGRWGARHLVLIGRRGMASPEAPELMEWLARHGVEATVYPADVADPVAMARVLAATDDAGHPLRGVIHAAMQLDDGLIPDLGDERFRSAVTPKMGGAMVLDTLSRGRPLDFFVGFSSMTALIGSIGQANYSAGNLYVEALTRARHDAGLPALAIAWAGISDVGYVARHGLRDSLSGMGLLFLSPDQVLKALADLLGLPVDVVGVGGIDWGRMSAVLASATTPRLVDLLPPLIEGTEYRRDEFVKVLSDASPEDARCLVEDSLVQVLAGILQSSPDKIDRSKRLTDMGMDSLMTVELATSTSEQFQCNIPLAALANSAGTIRAIAELILVSLGVQARGSNGEAIVPTTPRNPDSVASGRPRTTSAPVTDVVA